VIYFTKKGNTVSDQKKVEAIIQAKNVGPAERARFNGVLFVYQFIDALVNGRPGQLLMSKADDPDDNVIIEYRAKED